MTESNTYNRELVLVKLKTPTNQQDLQNVIKPYDALVSILKHEAPFTYLQASGQQYTMDNLLDDLSSYEIEQVSRTGSAALV